MSSNAAINVLNFRTTDQVQFPLIKSYEKDCEFLTQLRNQSTHLEPHETSIQQLTQYISTFHSLSLKQSQQSIPFRWYTLINNKKSNPVTSYSSDFELLNLLYNLGVLYFKVAEKKEDLKKSLKFYQIAAGVFEEAKKYSNKIYSSNISANGFSLEISFDYLNCLSLFCLGLGQECVYEKALVEGKVKNGNLGKIAKKCFELFESCLNLKEKQFSEFLKFCKEKSIYFNLCFLFRLSLDSEQNGKFGLRVAFLKSCESLISSNKFLKQNYKDFCDSILLELKKAEKDNDVIYLEPIPSTLPQIDSVSMVSSIPFQFSQSDLFKGLLPQIVTEQIQLYNNERKINVVKSLLNEMSSLDSSLNSFLSSVSLPGSLQAFMQPQGLPSDLLIKSDEVKANGGAKGFSDNLNTLLVLAQENCNLVTDIEDLLDKEKKEDLECKKEFNSGWNRISSDELQCEMREKLGKHKEKLIVARKSDESVRKKFEGVYHVVEGLSCSKEDLESSIPNSVGSVGSKEESVLVLNKLLQNCDELKEKRREIISRLREVEKNDDPEKYLLEAFNSNSSYESVFQDLLKKFDQFKQEIKATQERQSSLLGQIKQANENFLKTIKNNEGLKQRQSAINTLQNGYMVYKELNDNFNEGIGFYSKLGDLLRGLKGRVGDYVKARSLEKVELLRDIQRVAVGHQQSFAVSQGQGSQGYQYGQMPQPYQPQPGVWNPSQPLVFNNQNTQSSNPFYQNTPSNAASSNPFYSNSNPPLQPPRSYYPQQPQYPPNSGQGYGH